MKVTLAYLNNSKGSLTKLVSQDISISLSWILKKILKIVNEEYEAIEQSRVALIKKYGTKDANGNIKVLDDSLQKFNEEYATFLSSEVEIPIDKPIDLTPYMNEIKLSAVDLAVLDKIVTLNI